MTIILLYTLLAVSLVVLALLAILVRRSGGENFRQLKSHLEVLQGEYRLGEARMRDEFGRNRGEIQQNGVQLRGEMASLIKSFGDTQSNRVKDLSSALHAQLEVFSNRLQELFRINQEQLGNIRKTFEERFESLQVSNQKKLDEMRAIVDEKLQSTLEKRLGESFKMVGERLEQVYRGLGEMQKLATGVGDLKKVLANVKTRGTWGEFQLGNILEQMLSPRQYERNVQTKQNSGERVEYAIKLPGKGGDGTQMWLPIDAKFPLDQYRMLEEAYENAVPEVIENERKQLEARIKLCAKDISQKYLNPPETTDFALMYLPVEGLYAEVLRLPGLVEALQGQHRVTVTGPSTLAALVNSLQMGFRTLAVEKRSSEIQKTLGAVKNQFGKFGDLLQKTRKKLDEASQTIEDATKKTRHIQGRLSKVEELPEADAVKLLESEKPEPNGN